MDGVIKVWSFNPIMQTKASSISKSPLLSLEWATKRDRLVSSLCVEVQQMIWDRVACSLLDSWTVDKTGAAVNFHREPKPLGSKKS